MVEAARDPRVLPHLDMAALDRAPLAQGPRHDRDGGRVIVLVVDLADHRLDQVFHRDQAVGAAELVDDQGHVDTAGAHAEQEVGGLHRSGHVQRVTAQLVQHQIARRRPFGLVGEQAEDVLDVDDADGIVEGLAIDRHPRVLGLGELRHHHFEWGRELDRDDVGARGHDVGDPQGLEGLGLVDDVDGAGRGWGFGRPRGLAAGQLPAHTPKKRPHAPASASRTGGLLTRLVAGHGPCQRPSSSPA